jgi:hypothetical protein
MKRSLCSLACVFAAASAWAASVDYIREVKPILAENCYRCHGVSQQRSALRLDTAALALKGGDNGPALKPGNSPGSLLVQLVKGTHADLSRMPYKKPPLTEAQIALLAQWIDQGANAPAQEEPEKNVHWSFVAPKRTEPPAVREKTWPCNPIDNFVLARLEQETIKPSPETDRITLIRRLNLDLTGLPPSIAEVDAFVSDRSADAYERLVEHLLASPHYGERWGRHWLDVARYADSNGYSIDAPRSIWKYRDWVIHALNRDMPFDQFAIWQLAGDLVDTNQLAPSTSPLEPLIATGFNRNTQINQEGGIDPEQFRVESVLDRVNTTGTAFLGLTIGCAQCHDHKFDPITQREYYQLFAFFNNTVEDGHGKSAPEGMLEIPGETEAADNLQKELEEAEADLDRYLDTKGSEVVKWEQALTFEDVAELKSEVRNALKVRFPERTKKQKRLVYAAFRSNDSDFKQRNAKLEKLEKRQPKPVTTLVMMETRQPRETTVFIKGDFTRPGARVTPGVPAVLNPLNAGQASSLSRMGHDTQPAQDNKSRSDTPGPAGAGEMPVLPSRLDLARWIVNTNNPLTARVIVNRIWQQYFGKGLVETENDFGTQGTPPSHLELLDWLACELMTPSAPGNSLNGSKVKLRSDSTIQRFNASNHPSVRPWSLKHVHRLIVTSSTYRQSSKARPELATIDPNNKLLSRQNRLRLDAEIVRDVCLSASGLLNDKIGGPSVFPPQPDGVMNLGQSKREWKPSTGPDRYRRGMYTFFWRATPHPALMLFDSADGFSTCTRRLRSNTPLQALTLLNDEAFHEFARALAARVVKEDGLSKAARMEHAFRLCFSRPPAPDEQQRLLTLLEKELARGDGSTAWTTVSRVLLNLDETITRE